MYKDSFTLLVCLIVLILAEQTLATGECIFGKCLFTFCSVNKAFISGVSVHFFKISLCKGL